MRTIFLHGLTRKKVLIHAPWAAKIIKVEGGHMAFESKKDYLVWKNQK